ncbi:MAG: hypothetical protein QXN75_04955 [Thermoproteota archaeon]
MKNLSLKKAHILLITLLLTLPIATVLAALFDSMTTYVPILLKAGIPVGNHYLRVYGEYNAGQNYYYLTLHALYAGEPAGAGGYYRFRGYFPGDKTKEYQIEGSAILPFSRTSTKTINVWYAETRFSYLYGEWVVYIRR